MQSFYADQFDREMGCTEAEWLMWLPGAIGPTKWQLNHGSAAVQIDDGKLELSWRLGEPRVIALMRMPRLIVTFRFAGLNDAERYAFMKRFDLFMHRGGG